MKFPGWEGVLVLTSLEPCFPHWEKALYNSSHGRLEEIY